MVRKYGMILFPRYGTVRNYGIRFEIPVDISSGSKCHDIFMTLTLAFFIFKDFITFRKCLKLPKMRGRPDEMEELKKESV